jgi:hypothetical protein
MTQAFEAIIDEARAAVAAKREPNAQALEARLRAAAKQERTRGDSDEIDKAEQDALEQLKRVVSVHRARIRLSREPAPPPVVVPPPSLRALLRTQPTITGNMDVSRKRDGETLLLRWDASPAVAEWEVRFSERADARSDYAVIETLTLPGTATSVEVPLGERTMRIHLLGKGRNGKIVRRSLISALTRDTWSEKWERRA